ncbi:hypothetical protein Tco_1229047 [Tanacetum coccineum]
MSTSTHPVIILSDFNIEDAFSSTDYTPASLDYSPALLGNTSSDSKTELDERIMLLIRNHLIHYPHLLFHHHMHQFVPIERLDFYSLMILNLSRSYLDSVPEEIMMPQKRAHFLSPSSSPTDLSAPPQRHEEQINTILNHLDEFPLERIEQIEYGIEGLVDGRIEQIKHDDKIVPRVKISTLEILIEDIQVTMALLPPGFLEPLYPGIMAMINAQDIKHIIPPAPPRDTKPPVRSPIPSSPFSSVGSSSPVRSTTPPLDYPFDESIFTELDNSLWIIPRPPGSEPVSEEPNESDACLSTHLWNNCTEDSKVKFATGTLTKDALSWWNSFYQPIGIEKAYKTTWSELKKLLTKKYYPRIEVKKIEDEFYSLAVNGMISRLTLEDSRSWQSYVQLWYQILRNL